MRAFLPHVEDLPQGVPVSPFKAVDQPRRDPTERKSRARALAKYSQCPWRPLTRKSSTGSSDESERPTLSE